MRLLLCVARRDSLRAQQPADLILHNGKIVTADANFTIAEAIVIRGDHIEEVGKSDLLKKYTAKRVIDLKARRYSPASTILISTCAATRRTSLIYPK